LNVHVLFIINLFTTTKVKPSRWSSATSSTSPPFFDRSSCTRRVS